MSAPKSLKKIWPSLFDRPTQNVDHTKIWRLNADPFGVLHRDYGRPAIVRENGSKEWWVNGQLHRDKGPAVEGADGKNLYYRNGVETPQEAPARKTWWKRKLHL